MPRIPGLRRRPVLRTSVLTVALLLASAGGAVAIETELDPGPSAAEVVLGADPDTGNLFAVVRWGNDWGVYHSTNQGTTWDLTYEYDGFLKPGAEIDLVVEGGYGYVANSHGSIASVYSAAIRRFDATTGLRDEAWGSHTVRSDDVHSIREIGIDATESGTLFYLMLLSNDVVMCYVGSEGNGAIWSTEPTLIDDADRGLDVQHPRRYMNYTNAVLLYVSYVSTADAVSLSRLHQDFDFSTPVTVSYESAADQTSISAQGRNVVVAWEFQGTPHQGVRSMTAEEKSAQTQDWTLWPEWESGSGPLYDPRVAVRDELYRNAFIYENATQILYREQLGWSDAWGSTVTPINGHTITAGEGDRYAFEWMPEGFAVAYLGADGKVWFSHPELVFAESFEGGDTSIWSATAD